MLSIEMEKIAIREVLGFREDWAINLIYFKLKFARNQWGNIK